jgi:hypothetical protein
MRTILAASVAALAIAAGAPGTASAAEPGEYQLYHDRYGTNYSYRTYGYRSYGYAPAYGYGYAPAYGYGYAPAYGYGYAPSVGVSIGFGPRYGYW